MADLNITDWNDLNNIRNNLSGSHSLQNNLDSNTAGYSTHVSGPSNGWEPIGSSTNPFSGEFNGNGYSISDLIIDRGSEDNVGFFHECDHQAPEIRDIKNITFKNADITGNQVVGILSSSLQGGGDDNGGKYRVFDITIENSNITGNDEGVGSLCGVARGYSNSPLQLQNIYVHSTNITGNFDGRHEIGGVVGVVSGIDNNKMFFAVDVNIDAPNGDFIGGAFGQSQSSGTYNTIAVHGNINGNSDIGGIAAQNNFGQNTVLEESYSAANLNGNNNVGGIVPDTDWLDSQTNNIYWDTEVSGVSVSGGDATGLTTSEMTGSSAFTNMNFTTDLWKETVKDNTTDAGEVIAEDGYPTVSDGNNNFKNSDTQIFKIQKIQLDPISLDGDYIKSVTIDGNTVQELVVDGNTVHRKPPTF